MFARFPVYITFYLVGPSAESLNVSARFTHGEHLVEVSFIDGEPKEIPDSERHARFYRQTKGFSFTLEGPNLSVEYIRQHQPEFLDVIRTFVLRTFRAIRYFGIVPELPETMLPAILKLEPDLELWHWHVDVSPDGQVWESINDSMKLKSSMLWGALVGPWTLDHCELNVIWWSAIQEALELNLEPSAESEFYTNAVGHVRKKNFRLAIVEIIIGLEIVMTQFLRAHLNQKHNLSKSKINHFLDQFDSIYYRVSVLLDVVLHPSWLREIDRKKILDVINWRNAIAHKTGRLPADIPEQTYREGISAVRELIDILATRRDNIKAEPELDQISIKLAAQASIFRPLIWLEKRHAVRMDIVFFSSTPSDEPELQHLAAEASRLLQIRDSKFDAKEHLTIYFKTLGGEQQNYFALGRPWGWEKK